MPRNGAGTYIRVPGTAYTNTTTADGSELDAEQNDIAAALTGSLAANGETAFAGNFNGAGYQISNITISGVDVSSSGVLGIAAGSLAFPSLKFTASPGTGIYRHAADIIGVAAANILAMTIAQDVVDIVCGRLKFPTIQAPSTDPNTLDDYEEGTWTPTGNGVTLTVNSAKYIKVGKLVTAFFNVSWPSTVSTADARILSLPFTVDSAMHGAVAIGYNTSSTAALGVVELNTSYIILVATSAGTVLTNANFSTRQLIGVATYMASA